MNASNGIVNKNVANLHGEKSIDSEQVSQAIMGQPVTIAQDDGDWLFVRTWDTYQGWIPSRWVSEGLPRPTQTAVVTSLFTDALQAPDLGAEIITKLVITTTIEASATDGAWVRVRLPDGTEAWVLAGDTKIVSAGEGRLPLCPSGSEIIRTARRFMGIPYLWGGTTPFGLDCSGFVQLVYKLNGMALLRDAHMQASDPRAVSVGRDNLSAGDLVFFAQGEDKSRINHVGLACGDGMFIHSTGDVGVGINHLSEESYSRDLRCARRMSCQSESDSRILELLS